MIKLSFLAAAAFAVAAPALAAPPPFQQFNDTCSPCHQRNGVGVKGAFPALAGNPFVQGDGVAVAKVVLNGRAGMPSFKDDLSDAELATILTYVRTSWGNKGKAVTPAMVATARAGKVQNVRGLQAH